VKLRPHIPNALTCVNLALGCYACILALSGHYPGAVAAVLAAATFDFADGLAARLLKACSPVGKDLDSLADMVSFGLAPGMMLFDFMARMQQTHSLPLWSKLLLLAAFAIPIGSAIRLARFNHDTRQHTSFIGLPVPAHALFWASLLLVLQPADAASAASPALWNGLLNLPVQAFLLRIPAIYLLTATALLALGSSLMLVSELPMFSLKIKSLAWQGNELRYTLLMAATMLTVGLGSLGITFSILLYILFSIFNRRE
jgi:CDP-diacylglycerol--serine O-phosphatidyltransferase